MRTVGGYMILSTGRRVDFVIRGDEVSYSSPGNSKSAPSKEELEEVQATMEDFVRENDIGHSVSSNSAPEFLPYPGAKN